MFVRDKQMIKSNSDMKHMLVSDREFKITVIYMIKSLMEKVDHI